MKVRVLQFFFLTFLLTAVAASGERAAEQVRPLKFDDVDGHTLSTADGHFTVLVVATQANLPKAKAVGERVPDFCLGNPEYRMITMVKFGKRTGPIRAFLAAMTRHRLDAEAKQLQKRYAVHKIDKNARADMFAVTNFDDDNSPEVGSATSDFSVMVFGRNGELLKKWDDVPTTDELAAALKP